MSQSCAWFDVGEHPPAHSHPCDPSLSKLQNITWTKKDHIDNGWVGVRQCQSRRGSSVFDIITCHWTFSPLQLWPDHAVPLAHCCKDFDVAAHHNEARQMMTDHSDEDHKLGVLRWFPDADLRVSAVVNSVHYTGGKPDSNHCNPGGNRNKYHWLLCPDICDTAWDQSFWELSFKGANNSLQVRGVGASLKTALWHGIYSALTHNWNISIGLMSHLSLS